MTHKLNDLNQRGHSHFIVPLICIAVIAFVGARVLLFSSHAQTNCTVNAILVNSCRPWIGAAVAGDPSAPAADKIAQFDYLEKQIGHPLDIFHDYHPAGDLPLNSEEVHFADRADTYIYINWKPANKWADADGNNAAVNAQIKTVADHIKGLNHKVFLTVHHEPENDVSAFDNTTQAAACHNSPYFTGFKGSAGTPDQYRAMWQNVQNIFSREGVTNVVWVMNYMGYRNWDCLIPYMWPGNNLVDWVTMDAYGSGNAPTWDNSVGRIYNVLKADNGLTVNGEKIDFTTNKAWGAAEFGVCNSANESAIDNYFASAKTALDTNAYPLLKMYMVYDDTGNNAGPGCLVDHLPTGAYDGVKLSFFDKFADDAIFKNAGTPQGPAINTFTANPGSVTAGATSSLTWSTSNTSSCSINPGGPQGTTSTSWTTPKLTASTTFALSCKGNTGTSVSRTVTVAVTTGGGGGNGNGAIVGIDSKCLDNYHRLIVDYNKIDLFHCNGTPAQQWTLSNSGAIVNANGYCLDVYHDNTAAGTNVDLFHCNGTPAQVWKVDTANHTIVNPHSGLCLADKNGGTTDYNQIDMERCNNSAAEVWHVAS